MRTLAIQVFTKSKTYQVVFATLPEHVDNDGLLKRDCTGYAISRKFDKLEEAVIAKQFIFEALEKIND